ncbi:hypothetical protein WOLCODRAFT_139056 [Wolfiporia cocos MD-104 SS10]|uniref:Uncharacterized protein n=1 Tax=Wolfiporia cocos (strain MD-104) TaxID=742152 RepID=A0A2H3K315_WOLCO|nr:hypothetical protein WOLCODRAFT_139056 [Wolfiporia cocos MD-104 SS10]
MQGKFVLNPTPSYSERMSSTRGEIRRIMQQQLREITGDDVAVMRYNTYWKDIVTRYRVVIQGWPQDVPFRNLSDVSNLGKLDILLQGWQSGTIRFRHITDEEYEFLSAERAAGHEIWGGNAMAAWDE